MRTVVEQDEVGEPGLIHVVIRTRSKKNEEGLYYTQCGEVLVSIAKKPRTSTRQPTCIRCLGEVVEPIEIIWP